MKFFKIQNFSIKTKITAIILLISLVCILMVMSVFIYINHQDEQKSMVDNISVLAKLIGNRSSAALTFNDVNLAQENLASLKSHPDILFACLFDQSGKLFGSFTALTIEKNICFERKNAATTFSFHQIKNKQLQLAEPIYIDNEHRGSLYIRASLQAVEENLTRYFLIATLVGLAVGIIALLFASTLQRFISQPLTQLSLVATSVAEKNDYSVRAEKYGEDEIGELVDSFNGMLATIGQQNKALRDTSEKANAANAIKSQFLANMSHELRTPINGVLGMLSLLNYTSLNEEQSEYLTLASQSGNVLLDTVNQILDLASIESVGLNLKPEPVDCNNFLDDLSQLFASQLASHKLDLAIYVAADVPQILSFDPVRVRQVFINLIANAIKFTNQGGITVKINWHNQRLKVTVKDTGVGIPPEAQARVFESFQQADNSSTRAFGGTGLGLAIAQQVCTAMDGWIQIEKSTSAGSIFSFVMTAPRAVEDNINQISFKVKAHILALCQAAPLGNWLESTLTKQHIKYECYSELIQTLKALPQATKILVDSRYGIKTLQTLLDNAKQQQTVIWMAWVGETLPAELTNQVTVIYKPLSEKSLAELLNKNTSSQTLLSS